MLLKIQTHKRIFFTLLALTSSLIAHGTVFGQTGSAASTPEASSNNVATGHSYFGFDLGVTGSEYLGQNNFFWAVQTDKTLGTYLPYDNLGTGKGFVGGIKASVGFTPSFDLEWKLRYLTNYSTRQDSVSGILLDPYHPGHPAPTSNGTNNYSLTLSNIDLAMLGHYRITDWLYAAGGFSVSGLTGYTYSASQQISGSYFRLTTHGSANISEQQTDASSVANWFSGLRGDAQIGIGSVYRIGSSNMLLDAELLVGIPLTAWLSKAADSSLKSIAISWDQPAVTNPHLWYATLTVGLRLPFKSLPPPPEYQNSSSSIPPPSNSTESDADTAGTTLLSGHVIDAQTGKPVSADISAVNLADNKVVWTGKTDSNGNYSVRVHVPGKFSVTANKNGYLFGSAYFEVDSNGRILNNHSDIKLDNFSGGKTRLLVFFPSGKTELQPSSTPELNRAVDLMVSVPNLKVEIAGYSDTSGTYAHNKALSLQRANAVRDYLIAKGIAADRITAKGYGSDSPIAPNDTEEGRAENRRVEFIVISH